VAAGARFPPTDGYGELMEEDPTTQELRIAQLRREGAEREAAEEAPTDDAAEAHAKRAEKNAYLRRRLEERAEAERQAAREDPDDA
jgi:hypothetical protein